ncbi:hypothetical protein [Labedaea rhizosphaerae]|uniref:Uncharacterized protein n=1 Tax=Labedaea rhizosphaerae TaxID=598644 RepID=A0A4V3D0K9_LABRH|nr:hypothetical protein [Labedaea rhizosphaerae]TDQ05905.1 hypothetical protein EV186_1011883 [Labedaea rhizosphaerae]
MQPDTTSPRTGKTPVNVAMVRQHTPVSVSINEHDRVVSVLVSGDSAIVLLGLTLAGADVFLHQVARAVEELRRVEAHRAQR